MPGASSSCRGRPKRSRSTATSSTRCWPSPKKASASYLRCKTPYWHLRPRMPADSQFEALVTHVGGFHITDRSMKRAQEEAAAAIAAGALDDRVRHAYLGAVLHYFQGFQKEARVHLR